MSLSLCMIVRDNALIIEDALKNIRPWVDEMIVVDTGSLDDTPHIAARLGAKVSQFTWIDDFSAARNASIKRASCDWVFWMDSDDIIDQANGGKLRALANGAHDPRTLGYVMQVHCPGGEESSESDVTVVDHIKMFRRRDDLRFEGRIHEQILSSIRRAGGEVGWTDIHVVHKHGAVTKEDRAKKYVRDLRILQQDLAERPEHPFVLFNLGMTYADMEQYQEAADYLERSIAAAGPGESHLRKAYSLLIACRMHADELVAAERACAKALELFADDPELLFRAGVLTHQQKRREQAIEYYQKVLRLPEKHERQEYYFSSRDVGIDGPKARHNLAIVLSEQGNWRQAELQWRLALEESPGFQPALMGLGEALLKQRKWTAAAQLAECWRADPHKRFTGLLLDARLAVARNQPETAQELLLQASQHYPERREPLDELCKLLFERERPAEAMPYLQELARLQPNDGSVHHNLGSAYLASGEYALGIASLKRSLVLRPGSLATRELLRQAASANIPG